MGPCGWGVLVGSRAPAPQRHLSVPPPHSSQAGRFPALPPHPGMDQTLKVCFLQNNRAAGPLPLEKLVSAAGTQTTYLC